MDTTSEHIERLQDAMVRTRASASSADDGVTVETGADGALYAIRLGPAAEALSRRELVDAILESHNAALADAIAKLHEIAEELTEAEPSLPAGESALPADEISTAVQEFDEYTHEYDPPEETTAPADPSVPVIEATPAEDSLPSYPDSHVIRPGAEPDDDARYAVILEEPRPRRRIPPLRRNTRPSPMTHTTDSAGTESEDVRAEYDPLPYPAWLEPGFLDPEAGTREAADVDILSDPLWDNWRSDSR